MKNLFLVLVVLLLVSCGNGGDHAGGHMADTGSVPLVDTAVADHTHVDVQPRGTVDHFAGVLPCADCGGIETEISLTSDHKYTVHTIYQGRKSKGPGSNEFSEEGSWMQHGSDTIHLQGRKEGPSMFIRTDSSLIQLDMKGQRITGQLAARYELKKIGN